MKSSTALNHLQRLSAILRDIYGAAKIYNQSCHQLIAEVREKIWEDTAFKGCPSWIRVRLRAIDGELFTDLQQNYVVWGVWHNGKFLTDWVNYPEEIREKISTTNIHDDAYPQKHYWIKLDHAHGKTSTIVGDKLTRVYKITHKVF